MAELKLHLPDNLEQLFRKAAMAMYGYGRGSLSKAAIQAITEWCNHHQATEPLREVANPKEERPIAQPAEQEPIEIPETEKEASQPEPDPAQRTQTKTG